MRQFAHSITIHSVAVVALGLAVPSSVVGQEAPPSVSPSEAVARLSEGPPVLPAGHSLASAESLRLELGPLTAAELSRPSGPGPLQIGVRRAVPPSFAQENSIEDSLPEGQRVWRAVLRSQGAVGVRVHFKDFSAGAGEVWVYAPPDQDPQRTDVRGPYMGAGPHADGEFWSGTVHSDTVIVEWDAQPGNTGQPTPPFEIDAITHRWGSPAEPSRGFQALAPDSGSTHSAQPLFCELDVACYPGYASSATGVVNYEWVDGIWLYFCTGAMINTRASSLVPYVLTANHCIGSDAQARNVEVYFRYQTSTCNGIPPSHSSVPRVEGAQFLAGAPEPQGDYSLLRLSGSAPTGTVFLGWNTADPATSDPLAVIQHPQDSWKRIAFGARADWANNFPAATFPSDRYYQVRYQSGVTEAGSSGSPLINSQGQILGTLTAGPSAVCGSSDNWDVYGRFSNAYPALRQWLEDVVPCVASVSSDRWKGEYFNNLTLSGNPVMVRDDGAGALAFDWGGGTPSASCGIKTDGFSARWTRAVAFAAAGTYRFHATADDGVRLYVDGALKIDQWRVQGATEFTADVALTAGTHTLIMEYYEATGAAMAKLSWEGPLCSASVAVPADHWKGEYFNNMTLGGNPLMVRDDGTGMLAFDWGGGSPSASCGIPADGFSARWTRAVAFDVAGTYRFHATADDGVRLYVDGSKKIDEWRIQGATEFTVNVDLTAGTHTLTMEYFEGTGAAVAKLSWDVPPPCLAAFAAAVAADHWKGEYFNNMTLGGSPVMVRDDGVGMLAFDWGGGSPSASCGIPADGFSVRWTRAVSFGAGRYRFHATADDGVRLYVDGALKIDQWRDQGATEFTADVDLSAGTHTLIMEYYEHTGGAVAKLSWEVLPPCFVAVAGDRWKGEYFNNMTLGGSPVMVRDDGVGMLAFDWGGGSPSASCGIPADGFSVRWTRAVSFGAGRYRFHATADDGVRLYVDGALKIDQWRDQGATEFTADVDLSAGTHTLIMEYYEHTGGAVAKLSWEVLPPCFVAVAADHWKGEYFSNMTLSGSPVMVSDDGSGALGFDWGGGSPGAGCGIPNDKFSGRWTRAVSFPAGKYRFKATADDGVRFYVDGVLKIEQWRDGWAELTADVDLAAGTHTLVMEYYEDTGAAMAKLSWEGPPQDVHWQFSWTNWNCPTRCIGASFNLPFEFKVPDGPTKLEISIRVIDMQPPNAQVGLGVSGKFGSNPDFFNNNVDFTVWSPSKVVLVRDGSPTGLKTGSYFFQKLIGGEGPVTVTATAEVTLTLSAGNAPLSTMSGIVHGASFQPGGVPNFRDAILSTDMDSTANDRE